MSVAPNPQKLGATLALNFLVLISNAGSNVFEWNYVTRQIVFYESFILRRVVVTRNARVSTAPTAYIIPVLADRCTGRFTLPSY